MTPPGAARAPTDEASMAAEAPASADSAAVSARAGGTRALLTALESFLLEPARGSESRAAAPGAAPGRVAVETEAARISVGGGAEETGAAQTSLGGGAEGAPAAPAAVILASAASSSGGSAALAAAVGVSAKAATAAHDRKRDASGNPPGGGSRPDASRNPARGESRRGAPRPPGVVIVDLDASPERGPRPTMLASESARRVEDALRALGGPYAGAAARGHGCFVSLAADEPGTDALAGLLAARPPAGLVVAHLPARLWTRALGLELPGLVGALLRIDLPAGRALAALAVADLRERGLLVRVASRPLGRVASRRALAGLEPGGESSRRARRLAAGLLPNLAGAAGGGVG